MSEELEAKKEEEGGGAPEWMTTFSDLMSLLLAFFVLLFSFSEMDRAKYKEVGGSLKEAFGVQQEIQLRDPVKGLTMIGSDFSPGRPDPTTLNEVRQETTNVYKLFLAANEDAQGGSDPLEDTRGDKALQKGQIGRETDTKDTTGYGAAGEILKQAAKELASRRQERSSKESGAKYGLATLADMVRSEEEIEKGMGPGDVLRQVAENLEEQRGPLSELEQKLEELVAKKKIEEMTEAKIGEGGEKAKEVVQLGSGLLQRVKDEERKALAEEALLEQLSLELDRQKKISGVEIPASEVLDNLAKEEDTAEAEQSHLEVSKMRLEREFSREIEEGKMEVISGPDKNTVVIRVGEELAFQSGSAVLSPAVDKLIGEMADMIKSMLGTVIVAGHTDSLPISTARFRSNWDLSAARAASVVHGLMKKGGIPSRRFRVEAYADTKPIASNKTAQGRSKNRRVEITLSRRDVAQRLMSAVSRARRRLLKTSPELTLLTETQKVVVEGPKAKNAKDVEKIDELVGDSAVPQYMPIKPFDIFE